VKFLATIVSGVIVGALGVFFTLDWQEENLEYSITTPAKFGEINYQNIEVINTGWNPAINLKVYIDHPNIKYDNIQSKTSLKSLSGEENGIAGLERIRRDETVTISIAYEGQPLFGTEVKIVSDRSMAAQIESNADDSFPVWATIGLSVLGFWLTIGVLASIAIPAYRDYMKRAKEVQAKMETEQASNQQVNSDASR
jgi:hypothetical protein